MLVWEGFAMFLSIVIGGCALIYYIYREMREGKRLQQFFAAFTHEIKTPLASARLKGEILKERIRDPENISLINKMLTDVGRLSVRLENSLFLADEGKGKPFIEEVSIHSVVSALNDYWPDLVIRCSEGCTVFGDRRIMDTVIANLLQNAVIHGKATEVTVSRETCGDKDNLTFQDNGNGFSGERVKLGDLFGRHYAGSGSGIGLYLVKQLIGRVGGKVYFPETPKGFAVTLSLKRTP